MNRYVAEVKKDADKDRAQLITELKALRDLNSRLKDVVKRYEKVADKNDLFECRYDDLDVQKQSVETLRDDLREKQKEVDFQGEELGVQNEELRAQLEEINARDNEAARMNAALRESEERYRSLFEHMLNGFAYCKMLYDDHGNPEDFFYLAVNIAFGRLTGLENVVGKRATEAIPEIKVSHPELFEIYGRVAATGKPEQFETEFKPLAAWLSVSVYSTGQGYFTAVFDNITERKRAEEELRMAREELELRVQERTSELEKANAELEDQVRERQRSEMALRASEEDLQRANRALKALSKCREAMIRAEDEAALLDDICRIVVDVGGYRLAWIGYVEEDELRTVRPVARAGYDEGYVDNLKIALNHPVYGNGPTGISLKSGKPYGSRNVQTDDNMQPWRTDALKRGYLSTLNLPLMYEGEILGALVIYSGSPGAFDSEEMGLLIDLADNLAYGIRSIRNRVLRDRAEKELLRAKDELEVRVDERTEELKSAKAQSELYLDLMGHDINNMNQSAMGYLELALETLETDGKIGLDGKLFIEKPLQAINSSSKLIENVRKLQRLMTEGVKTLPIDLHDLFGELNALDFHAGDKDVTVNFGQVPHYVVNGNELLRDVFNNLINNAVKHSRPDKPVTVDVRVERVEYEGRAFYRCSIEDDGPGIPDALKPKLFHRFQRGKTLAHGKGLGLYIVRTLVEGYHGNVWVEDRVPGDHTKGARFVVMLPSADKA